VKAEAAPLLIKITSARTAELAGTNQFQTLHMVNTKNVAPSEILRRAQKDPKAS